MFFTQEERKIARIVLKKIQKLKSPNPKKWPIISFTNLYKLLSPNQIRLLQKIQKIHPSLYGFKATKFGREKPKNLVIIQNQIYFNSDKAKKASPQYLPKKVYFFFCQLNQQMQADIKRRLNVLSGYRSPAYQSYIFLMHLVKFDFNIKKTLRYVALPYYSEHASPKRQAVDFAPAKSISDLKDFYKTKEYKWLKIKARNFGFYLSYPKNNRSGVVFEPWHWHFRDRDIVDK